MVISPCKRRLSHIFVDCPGLPLLKLQDRRPAGLNRPGDCPLAPRGSRSAFKCMDFRYSHEFFSSALTGRVEVEPGLVVFRA